MSQAARTRRALALTAPAGLAAAVALGAAVPAPAAGQWSVEVEPVYTQVYGHDPHVLTVHEFDFDADPAFDRKTAVDLESDSDFAYRAAVQWTPAEWTWGLDFWTFRTPQATADRSAAADGPGGPIETVVFEVADQSFASSGPGQDLFYRVLEDTTIETWTLDLYGLRTLASGPDTTLRLQLGLRNADFDNDYRAVVGIEDVVGSRLDASSNYDRMMGPLVGLAGSVERGRSTFTGYLGQSVVIGSVELKGRSREFFGEFSETTVFVAEESFQTEQDVAIPITELRLDWSYRLSDLVALGAGVDSSAWWDLPVPPGLTPIEDGDEALHEATLVYLGLAATVKLTF